MQIEEVTDYAWLPFGQMPMRHLANRLQDWIKISSVKKDVRQLKNE